MLVDLPLSIQGEKEETPRSFPYQMGVVPTVRRTETIWRLKFRLGPPIKDPFHHISSWNVWNFMPYLERVERQDQNAKISALTVALRSQLQNYENGGESKGAWPYITVQLTSQSEYLVHTVWFGRKE